MEIKLKNTYNPEISVQKSFTQKAKKRSSTATGMLIICLVIIALGLFAFLNQMRTVSDSMYDSLKLITTDTTLTVTQKDILIKSRSSTELYNIIGRTVFLIVIFFIAQIFLKLYRHNLIMADFYDACCNSIDINKEYETEAEKDQYIKLLKVLHQSEIKIEVPESPSIAELIKNIKG